MLERFGNWTGRILSHYHDRPSVSDANFFMLQAVPARKFPVMGTQPRYPSFQSLNG